MSCGFNKVAYFSHVNAQKKKRCCCARDPLFAPGLHVEIIKNVDPIPVSLVELQRFNYGEIQDMGVTRGAISLPNIAESSENNPAETLRDRWVATIPELGRSGVFDEIRERNIAEGGATFALRFTGQMFFTGEESVHVRTDDGLTYHVNGVKVGLTKDAGGDPISLTTACAEFTGDVAVPRGWNSVEIVWWNKEYAPAREPLVGDMCLALLDDTGAAVDPRRFRHAVQN